MDEMDEMEMNEPFLDPPSQLQARPASASTGISSPADLQPDTIYCDSQDVLECVNLTDSQFPLKDAAKVVVPHTLSLELLHYFGPFFTGTRTNYVYVANFENDNSHVVLISHWTNAKETAQMDFYLNRIFKIQNFLTISSKGIHFDCGNIECVIAEKPLHDIAIVVNETLNSTLEFNESFRELTKLSEVINPSNKVQAFNFVNVIGFVEAFSRTNKADILLISDEETKNFRVYLGYCQLDQLKQNPLQSDVEKMFFSSSDRSVVYPPLKKGDLVCIRDLCLGSGPINIVVHPDQLYVIKPYKSNVILQDNTFSDNEIERIHKLLTEFANIKVQNPVPYKISNHDILDFCGLVLAKLEYPPVNNKSTRVELFLLLPYKSSLPTYLTEKTGYIVNYISSKCSTELNIYNQEIINELVERNRIVTVTLYGVNAQSAESVNIYHQVLLVNVHLKKDLYFSGFYQLIMHDGQDNGKGCFVIDNDSILGEKVSKSIKELNQEVFLQSPLNYMSEEDLNQNFDEEIVNRYNGPENLNAVAESQQKQSSLYKNSFRDIVQASIKKTSLKGQQAVIRCYINEQISMRVNSFAEMVEEIQKGLETTIVVGQNAERDGTPFPPKSFFLVSARMVNYIFEDDLGFPITDMHTFRRSLIKFYCKIPKCDNRASYLSVAPQISRIIASGDDHPDTSIRCSKCGENSMGLYLTLKFTIEDSFGQKFTCLLTSPEAEEFIGVTSQQLMLTSPRSGDICNAVESLLQTFCPYRRPLSRTPEGSLNSSSASNDPPLVPLNPKLEWIIQYARKEDANESISADFLNGHMFDLNSTVNGTPIRHFFYIRGISELSPP